MSTEMISILTSVMTIRVWAWDHAPQVFKDRSTHGGDEDGVAVLPPAYAEAHDRPYWLERMWNGCGFAQIEPLGGGYTLVIWAHA